MKHPFFMTKKKGFHIFARTRGWGVTLFYRIRVHRLKNIARRSTTSGKNTTRSPKIFTHSHGRGQSRYCHSHTMHTHTS